MAGPAESRAKRARWEVDEARGAASEEPTSEEVAPPGTEVFVSEPSCSLLCPICMGVLKGASTVRACQHVFCRDCVLQALRRKRECPACRTKLCSPSSKADSLVAKNLLVNNIVGELQVYCRFGLSKAGDGSWEREMGGHRCPAVITLDQVASHERECEFARLPCPFDGCPAMLLRSDINTHIERNMASHMVLLNAEVAKSKQQLQERDAELKHTREQLDITAAQVQSTRVQNDTLRRGLQRVIGHLANPQRGSSAGLKRTLEEVQTLGNELLGRLPAGQIVSLMASSSSDERESSGHEEESCDEDDESSDSMPGSSSDEGSDLDSDPDH